MALHLVVHCKKNMKQDYSLKSYTGQLTLPTHLWARPEFELASQVPELDQPLNYQCEDRRLAISFFTDTIASGAEEAGWRELCFHSSSSPGRLKGLCCLPPKPGGHEGLVGHCPCAAATTHSRG